MKRTIDMSDVSRWIWVMSDSQGYNSIHMYMRFSGALSILCHLGLITQDEMNAWLDYYIRKNIAETGA